MNLADQEKFFLGVDASSDPALIKPGYVSESENTRYSRGVAMPRKGAVMVAWANRQAEYFDRIKTYQGAPHTVRYSPFKVVSGTTTFLTGNDIDGTTPTSNSGPSSSNHLTSSTNSWGVPSDHPVGPYFKNWSPSLLGARPISAYDASTGLVTLNGSWQGKGSLYLKYPGIIYGASNFETPNGVEHLVIATSQGIFVTSPDSASEEVKVNGVLYGHSSYPTITGDSKVRFVQCFNNLIMFRGDLHAPLVLTENLTNGFNSISQSETPEADENPDDGTEQIPNASTGLFFGNRLVIPFGRDEVAVSDYLNYTRYQPVRSAFRVNTGSSDKLVAVFKFDPNTLLVFKEGSIYAVRNVYGDLVDAQLDQVTDQYGCAAERSIVSAGSDVIFLSDQRGVVSIRQSVAGETQSVDVPLSQPIQPIIDRIDWPKAGDAIGAYSNNRYYLALPLRGVNETASGNNAVIVYDFLTKSWAGIDYMTGLSVKDFFLMTYKGAKRLFVITGDGQILLYDDEQFGGTDDHYIGADSKSAHSAISARIKTRGYTCGISDKKRFRALAAFVESYGGQYTIKAHADGKAESVTVSEEIFDRTKYDSVSRPDYDLTNSNDDFGITGREDYTVLAGDGIKCGSNGFMPNVKQSHADRDRYNVEGTYVQMEITTTSGTVDLRGLDISANVSSPKIKTER